jgi:hypothetical protein
VITGDLDRALATEAGSAGTWRPAPPGTTGGPRSYITTAAFRLAGANADPGPIAAGLAARLARLDWVAAATVTGGGYLTVMVTDDALARLAVRVTEAGPGCVRSSALAGTAPTAPAGMDLVVARTWEEARRRVHATVTGRLAEAAGALVSWTDEAQRGAVPQSALAGVPHPAADAIAYAGAGAVVYALARLPSRGPARVAAHSAAAH